MPKCNQVHQVHSGKQVKKGPGHQGWLDESLLSWHRAALFHQEWCVLIGRASWLLFPLIASTDMRQIGRFGLAHFVRRPILEGLIGRLIHRVLNDRGRRIWSRKTLPCKQVHANKQAKKDSASQRQLYESILS